jgi:hypothetical protein
MTRGIQTFLSFPLKENTNPTPVVLSLAQESPLASLRLVGAYQAQHCRVVQYGKIWDSNEPWKKLTYKLATQTIRFGRIF